jgi:hypothetical protein
MPETKKHPINHEWDEHYEMLEFIRRTGITNMWGAAPYLAEGANISRDLATKVLLSWIENYDELNKQFHWQ